MKPVIHSKYEKGQSWVLLAVMVIVLIIFVGIAIDAGILFSNYTKLKRAVDSAAVAAANDFKRSSTIARMTASAKEMIALHQLDVSAGVVDLKLYICTDASGNRDANLLTLAPDFYNKCPDTSIGPNGLPRENPRKLVYIAASQNMPTYFMHLLGVNSIRLSTTSISEAAPVDLVLVFDTSESMGKDTCTSTTCPLNPFPAPADYIPDDFDPGTTTTPGTCNYNNTCLPLRIAKDAAITLIGTLYPGYDRVAIVTFDQMAITRFSLSGNLTNASTAAGNVPLHDDAPAKKLFSAWYWNGRNGRVNPVNPEDRDNNGSDADPGLTCTLTADRWDPNAFGAGIGGPCDDASKYDAFDWNGNGIYDSSDDSASANWMSSRDPLGPLGTPPGHMTHPQMAIASTCSGCGMREASNVLVAGGRPNAVWVIVFLSDGVANMSDTYGGSGFGATYPTNPYNSSTNKYGIPANYPNGFCGGYLQNSGGTLTPNYWMDKCIDYSLSPRYCIDTDTTQCPPSNTITLNRTIVTLPNATYPGPKLSPPYSVEDYARDVTDAAALLLVDPSTHEPKGNDIAVFTVGLGDAAALGSDLLRYIASVGDDGNRESDPCYTVAAGETAATKGKTNCGNYYFAQTADDLYPVFDSIASRIYTKISE